MKKRVIILCLMCVSAVYLCADDTKKPSFQLEDHTFFDPTKKEEKEVYTFGMEYRVEVGYVQHQQRAEKILFPDMYLHGVRLGGTVTFKLPLHFGLQTGVAYTLLYGQNEQHWRSMNNVSLQKEYINHRVLAHNLTIPVRAFYTVPLWKELNLFFYTGPQLHIGLSQMDYQEAYLSDEVKSWLDGQGVATSQYDRMTDELVRANIQWGVGGGLEWAQYRLMSGYDFGLNNLVNHPKLAGQKMTEWGWHVSFCYRL